MASSTRDLIVRFIGDTKDLNGAVAKAESTMGKLKAAAIAVGGAYAATKVVKFLGDATAAAETDRKSQALLATQIRDTTGASNAQIAGVEKFINKLERQTGVMDDDLRPAYAGLVRATKDTDKAQAELATAMDIAAARGVDLQSVVTALEKAHNGQTTSLGRLGIATKDAAGNTLSLEQIMANAAKTYAGAAQAAITPSERWKVATEELKESIGAHLLPVIGKFEEMGANLLAWFDNLNPNVQLAIEVVAGFTVAALALAAAFAILTPAVAALGVAVAILTSPIGLIVVGVAALAAGLIYAYTHCETFRNIVDTTIDDVQKVMTTFVETGKKIWEDWGDTIVGVFNVVAGTVKTQIAVVRAVIQPIIDLLHGDWGKAWDDFKQAVVGIRAGVTQTVRGSVDVILGLIGGLVSGMKNAVNGFIRLWNNLDFTFPGYDIPGPGPNIPGFTIGLPDVPLLAQGGIVTRPTLALIGEAGPEAVVPLTRGGGQPAAGTQILMPDATIYVQMVGQYDPDKIVEAVQRHATRNSGVRIPGGVVAV